MRGGFLHRFGNGIGFGAEMLDLSWSYYHAIANGLSFAIHTNTPPQGVAVGGGWREYFVPFCPDVSLGPLSNLNQHLESRKGRLLHAPFRLTLDARLRKQFYYMFDRRALARRSRQEAQQGLTLDRGKLLQSIYRLNQPTQDFLAAHAAWKLQDEVQIALHLRRGDKINEAEHTDLDRYVRAIHAIPDWRSKGIYIMSDSPSARQELLTALGVDAQHWIASPETSNQNEGHDQKKFNKRTSLERKTDTLRLIAEVEIARKAQYFIGTPTSNLFHLVGLLRNQGRQGMVALEAWPE